MALGNQAWGDRVDEPTNGYTDQRHRVGTRRQQLPSEVITPYPAFAGTAVVAMANGAADYTPEGDRTWVFVFNDEAATAFAAGHSVQRDTADYADWDGILTTTAITHDLFLGIAQHGITAGRWGFIGRCGTFLARSDAGGSGAGTAMAAGAAAGSGRTSASGADEDANIGHVGGFATGAVVDSVYPIVLDVAP